MRFFFLPHLFRVFFDFLRVHPIALFHPSLGTWITGRFRRLLVLRLLFHHRVCVCVCLHNIDYVIFVINEKAFQSRPIKKKLFSIFVRKVVKKCRNAQNIFSYLPDVSHFTVQILRVEYTRALEYTNTKQCASSSLRRLYRVGKVSLRSSRRREGAFYVRVIRRKSLHFYRRR